MMSAAPPLTTNLVGLSEMSAVPAPLADAALFENLLMASALVVLSDGAATISPFAQPEIPIDAEVGVEAEPKVKDQEDPTLPDTLLALLGSPLPPAPPPIRATKAQDVAPPAMMTNATPGAEAPAALTQHRAPARASETAVPNLAGPDSLSTPAAEQAPAPSAPVAPAVRLVPQMPDAASAPADQQTDTRLPAPLPIAVVQTPDAPALTHAQEQPQAPTRAIAMSQGPFAEPASPDAQKLDPTPPAASAPTPMPEKGATRPAAASPTLNDKKDMSAPALTEEVRTPAATPHAPQYAQSRTSSAPISGQPGAGTSQADGILQMQAPMDDAPTQFRSDLPSIARVAQPISSTLDNEPVKGEGPDANPSALVLPSLVAPTVRPITAPDGNVVLAETSAAPLDLSPDLAFLDRLSAEISEMAREGGKLHFRLTPAHLGKLDVAVEAHGDAVSVHMQTQSPEAKSILTDAQSGLTQDLAARGLRLTETTVTLAGDGSLPRRNQQMPAATIETETPSDADAGSPIMARPTGRFA